MHTHTRHRRLARKFAMIKLAYLCKAAAGGSPLPQMPGLPKPPGLAAAGLTAKPVAGMAKAPAAQPHQLDAAMSSLRSKGLIGPALDQAARHPVGGFARAGYALQGAGGVVGSAARYAGAIGLDAARHIPGLRFVQPGDIAAMKDDAARTLLGSINTIGAGAWSGRDPDAVTAAMRTATANQAARGVPLTRDQRTLLGNAESLPEAYRGVADRWAGQNMPGMANDYSTLMPFADTVIPIAATGGSGALRQGVSTALSTARNFSPMFARNTSGPLAGAPREVFDQVGMAETSRPAPPGAEPAAPGAEPAPSDAASGAVLTQPVDVTGTGGVSLGQSGMLDVPDPLKEFTVWPVDPDGQPLSPDAVLRDTTAKAEQVFQDNPVVQAQAQAIKQTGQAAPGTAEKASGMLGAFGFNQEQATQIMNWWKEPGNILLTAGLGVAAVSLLTSLLGGSEGVMSWLVPLLGLGVAGGAAAYQGYLGTGAQGVVQGAVGGIGNWLSGLFNGSSKVSPETRKGLATAGSIARIPGQAPLQITPTDTLATLMPKLQPAQRQALLGAKGSGKGYSSAMVMPYLTQQLQANGIDWNTLTKPQQQELLAYVMT